MAPLLYCGQKKAGPFKKQLEGLAQKKQDHNLLRNLSSPLSSLSLLLIFSHHENKPPRCGGPGAPLLCMYFSVHVLPRRFCSHAHIYRGRINMRSKRAHSASEMTHTLTRTLARSPKLFLQSEGRRGRTYISIVFLYS